MNIFTGPVLSGQPHQFRKSRGWPLDKASTVRGYLRAQRNT